MQNFSYGNEFDLHENEPVGEHILNLGFSYHGFVRKTRPDTEARGNYDMTHLKVRELNKGEDLSSTQLICVIQCKI